MPMIACSIQAVMARELMTMYRQAVDIDHAVERCCGSCSALMFTGLAAIKSQSYLVHSLDNSRLSWNADLSCAHALRKDVAGHPMLQQLDTLHGLWGRKQMCCQAHGSRKSSCIFRAYQMKAMGCIFDASCGQKCAPHLLQLLQMRHPRTLII